MARNTVTIEERDDAIARLRDIYRPGTRVTTLVTHTTGSSQVVLVLGQSNDSSTGVTDLSWLIRRALGVPMHQTRRGVVMNGGGMDLSFQLVYNLGRTLYDDGYALTHDRL